MAHAKRGCDPVSKVLYPFLQAGKPHFVDFVYYEGMMLPHEIDMIQGMWRDDDTVKATLSGDATYDDKLRKSSVMGIEPEPRHEWLYQKLEQVAYGANHERYHFDMTGFGEALQLTRYGVGDFFDWHMDFGAREIAHRKLSITVQLSDPDDYEGGDLEFRISERVVKAPRSKGTIIVFPAFVQHRVTEITKGTRESIVAWVSGPAFR